MKFKAGFYIVLSFFLILSQHTLSQDKIALEGRLDDRIISIKHSADGNYIAGGYTNSSRGEGYDLIFIHFDKSLNEISRFAYEAKGNQYLSDFLVLKDNRILSYGKKEETINNYTRYYLFISMFDVKGKEIFYREYTALENDTISNIIALESGDFIAVGSKQDLGNRDMNPWLMQFNKKGNPQWQSYPGKKYVDDLGIDIIPGNENKFLLLCNRYEKEVYRPFFIQLGTTGRVEWEKELLKDGGDTRALKFFKSDSENLFVFMLNGESPGNRLSLHEFNQEAYLMGSQDLGNLGNNRYLPIVKHGNSFFIASDNGGEAGIIKISHTEEESRAFSLSNGKDAMLSSFLALDSANLIAVSLEKDKFSTNSYISIQGLNEGGSSSSPSDYTYVERSTSKTSRIIFLNPATTETFTSVYNTPELKLKLKAIDSDGVASVSCNNKKMQALEKGIYEMNVSLKTGFNDFEFKIMDNTGEETVSYFVLENKESKSSQELINSGTYYALIIAVSDYQDEDINDLDNPRTDAEKIIKVLEEKYTFEKENIIYLQDPDREAIISKLDELTRLVGKEDNLLIFYAGHGYWDQNSKIGYWLPSDARKNNTANWFRNSTLKDYLGAIPSKHILLVADACFSGAIFKTRSAFNEQGAAYMKLQSLPSRKAMTSGTLTEVPDESVFVKYLIKRLEENENPYISSSDLFSSLRIAVLNNSPTVPQFGEIKDTGDEGGDFIFILRK